MRYSNYQNHVYEVSNLGNVKIDGKLIPYDKLSNWGGYKELYWHNTVHKAVARLFIEKCQCECILTVDGKEKNLIIPSGNKIHIINIDTIDDLVENLVTKTLEVDMYENMFEDESPEDSEEYEDVEGYDNYNTYERKIKEDLCDDCKKGKKNCK